MLKPPNLSNEDLKRLLPKCLSKDEKAWETLFHSLFGFVKSVVLKAQGTRFDADDSIAEAFACVVKSIDDVAESRNPLAYIGAIAKHCAIASRKRGDRYAARETPLPGHSHVEDSDSFLHVLALSPDQETNAMRSQVKKELRRIEQTLSPDELDLVRLKVVEDLTYEEVAYILDREPGTLRVKMHRLVNRLREEVAHEIREPAPSDSNLFSGIALDFAALPKPEMNLPGSLVSLLERYVENENELSGGDRNKVEQALMTSSVLRELKTMLERNLMQQEGDVVGHSAPERMPDALLRSMMALAMKRPAHLQLDPGTSAEDTRASAP